MQYDPRDRIIIALDLPTLDEALRLVEQLDDRVKTFKVGPQLFTSVGPDIIRRIKSKRKKLFLDLKFHDIPNTVAKVTEAVVELGVDIFNVHISGGMDMMRAAVESAKSKSAELKIKRPMILGVTLLTSMDDSSFQRDFASKRDLQSQIIYMAELARGAGLDGVVSSPWEVKAIKKACGKDFIVVTPGIRTEDQAGSDDQKRVTTPSQALADGADYIIIGRPVYRSPDPPKALEQIIHQLKREL